jgi:hypothetical protein
VLIISLFTKKNWVLKTVIIISILLMTELARPLWQISLLAQIQFPWRLLMVPLVIIPFLLPKKLPKLLVIALIILAIYANRNHIRINMPLESFTPNHGTTTSTPNEFMPVISKDKFESNPVISLSRMISGVAVMVWGLLLLKSKYASLGSGYNAG